MISAAIIITIHPTTIIVLITAAIIIIVSAAIIIMIPVAIIILTSARFSDVLAQQLTDNQDLSLCLICLDISA